MSLEDIVEGLNRYIVEVRDNFNLPNNLGHLVLQKRLTPSEKFKAYKTYEVIIWFKRENNIERVFTYTDTSRIITDYEDIHLYNHNMEIIKGIFNLVTSEMFKLIINGEYRE